jgi:hypothetical protein
VATYVENLTAARDNLAAVVADQTAEWVAAGCPPTMSIEGESYQWDSWLTSKTEALDKLNTMIRQAKPYWKRSRHRG